MKPVPFKLWAGEVCSRMNLSYTALANRISRGKMNRPPAFGGQKRANFVLVDDATADRLFPEGIQPKKPRWIPKPKVEKPPKVLKMLLHSIKTPYCYCGKVATRKFNGAMACERCIAWEMHEFNRVKQPSWAKYADTARFHLVLA